MLFPVAFDILFGGNAVVKVRVYSNGHLGLCGAVGTTFCGFISEKESADTLSRG